MCEQQYFDFSHSTIRMATFHKLVNFPRTAALAPSCTAVVPKNYFKIIKINF